MAITGLLSYESIRGKAEADAGLQGRAQVGAHAVPAPAHRSAVAAADDWSRARVEDSGRTVRVR